MEVWGITHCGIVREQNQDDFEYRTLPDGRIIALVCDGMGGARAGNIASAAAVKNFFNAFYSEENETKQEIARLQSSAQFANEMVFQQANAEEECFGMGTTMVCALVNEEVALVLNVGDSRAYHISKTDMKQITRDHSLVEDLVQRGELTREQAQSHPHKNLITRALGSDPVLNPDIFETNVEKGDFILLCTDGLSNLFSDEELFDSIHGQQDVQQCARKLLDLSLQRGAPDNVTITLIKI